MLKWAYLDWLAQSPYTTSVLQRLALHDRPVVKDFKFLLMHGFEAKLC